MARANHHATYPARFQLIAAMNPCRCGYLGTSDRECTKAPRCGLDYQSKLSGPLLDRIDIHVDVMPVMVSDLTKPLAEPSEKVASRVARARQIQAQRFQEILGDSAPISVNAYADGDVLEKAFILTPSAQSLLNKAAEHMKFSARSYYRLIRVARTIADLSGDLGDISDRYIAEALSYRRTI